MNLIDLNIRQGRKIGWAEHNRIWPKTPSSEFQDNGEFGSFVSPSGLHWRYTGRHYPGVLLVCWEKGLAHSVDYATMRRLRRFGWKWVADGTVPQHRFRVTRWSDGTHYYLSKEDGDTIGKHKYDTYDQAHRAGLRWEARSK